MSDWNQLIATLGTWGEAAVAAAVSAVDELGEQILADSKELCPVSPTNASIAGKRKKRIKNPLYTGHPSALRDSGVADPAELVGDTIRKRIYYTANYAAAVHERTQIAHGALLQAKHPQANIPNLRGQAKFLAVPMLKRRKSGVALIAQRIAEANHA